MANEIDELISKVTALTEDKDESVKAMKEAWSSIFEDKK